MDDQGEGGTDRSETFADAHPEDGRIQFSRYSTEQLRELQDGIDRRAFPLNFANLIAELGRREAEAVATPSVASGRFTSRDGLRGWLEAKDYGAPLYGDGAIEIGPTDVTLRGWRRTWLGAPEQAEILVPSTQIRNVLQEGTRILFEYQGRSRSVRRVEFATTAPEARYLYERLPHRQDLQSERRWSELREFNRRIAAIGGAAWITPALVVANFAVFVAMAIVGGRLGGFELPMYMQWGANYGPVTLGGQWWRLLTAVFLHFNLAHVALNMWALWNVGRLCERLYGRWLLLYVYLASGLIASLASLLWNPRVVSVGASGAIFGVFGAFLAFLAHRRHEVPAAVARAHWLSTAVFVAYNLGSGALDPLVDNAAHVGGLIAGFALGWALARPLDDVNRQEPPFKQVLAALGITAVAIVAGVWQAHGFSAQRTAPEQYARSHAWFASGEAANLRLWQELGARYERGEVGGKETADLFEREVLPFWAQSNIRLRKELPSLPPGQRNFGRLLADVARSRVESARMVVKAIRSGQPTLFQDVAKFAQRVDDAVARTERYSLRSMAQYGARPLADSQWVARLRRLFSGGADHCVVAPVSDAPRTAATDSRRDGPAMAAAAACRAQQLFLSGDYVELDRSLEGAQMTLGDLPNGGSTLAALMSGLDNLFAYERADPMQLLERTADWRRAVPDSVEPELVEVSIFQAWAWAARGHGAWSSVTPEAQAMYAHRVAMSAAGLEDIATRAADNPVWYTLSIDVGNDRVIGAHELRAIFDSGNARVHNYVPLYRSMLRTLMPRWGGSYEQVDEFINEMTNKPDGRDVELYARLYWSYALLERNDIDLFWTADAAWPTMKFGLQALTRHYPTSDYWLNVFARLACQKEDGAQYRELRPLLEKRTSATAWSDKTSIESCDKALLAGASAAR